MPKLVVSESELKKIIIESLMAEVDAPKSATPATDLLADPVIKITEDITPRIRLLGKLASDAEANEFFLKLKALTQSTVDFEAGTQGANPDEYVSDALWKAFTQLQRRVDYTNRYLSTLRAQKQIAIVSMPGLAYLANAPSADDADVFKQTDQTALTIDSVSFRENIFENVNNLNKILNEIKAYDNDPNQLYYQDDVIASQIRDIRDRAVAGQIERANELESEYDVILYQQFVYEPLLFPQSWISIRDPDSANTPWRMTAEMTRLIKNCFDRDGVPGLLAIVKNLKKYAAAGGVPNPSYQRPPGIQESRQLGKSRNIIATQGDLRRIVRASLEMKLNEGEGGRIGFLKPFFTGAAGAPEAVEKGAVKAIKDVEISTKIGELQDYPAVKQFIDTLGKAISEVSLDDLIKNLTSDLKSMLSTTSIRLPGPVTNRVDKMINDALDLIDGAERVNKAATDADLKKEQAVVERSANSIVDSYDNLDPNSKARLDTLDEQQLKVQYGDKTEQIVSNWSAMPPTATSPLTNFQSLKQEFANRILGKLIRSISEKSINKGLENRIVSIAAVARPGASSDLTFNITFAAPATIPGAPPPLRVVRSYQATDPNLTSDRLCTEIFGPPPPVRTGVATHTRERLEAAQSLINSLKLINNDDAYTSMLRSVVQDRVKTAIKIAQDSQLGHRAVVDSLGNYVQKGPLGGLLPTREGFKETGKQLASMYKREMFGSSPNKLMKILHFVFLSSPLRTVGATASLAVLGKATGWRALRSGPVLSANWLKGLAAVVGAGAAINLIARMFYAITPVSDDPDNIRLRKFLRYTAAATSAGGANSLAVVRLVNKDLVDQPTDDMEHKLADPSVELNDLAGALLRFEMDAVPTPEELKALFPSTTDPGLIVDAMDTYYGLSEMMSAVGDELKKASAILPGASATREELRAAAAAAEQVVPDVLNAGQQAYQQGVKLASTQPTSSELTELENERKAAVESLVKACTILAKDTTSSKDAAKAEIERSIRNSKQLMTQVPRVVNPDIGTAGAIESGYIDTINGVLGDDNLAQLYFAWGKSGNPITDVKLGQYYLEMDGKNLGYGPEAAATYNSFGKAIRAYAESADKLIRASSTAVIASGIPTSGDE